MIFDFDSRHAYLSLCHLTLEHVSFSEAYSFTCCALCRPMLHSMVSFICNHTDQILVLLSDERLSYDILHLFFPLCCLDQSLYTGKWQYFLKLYIFMNPPTPLCGVFSRKKMNISLCVKKTCVQIMLWCVPHHPLGPPTSICVQSVNVAVTSLDKWVFMNLKRHVSHGERSGVREKKGPSCSVFCVLAEEGGWLKMLLSRTHS